MRIMRNCITTVKNMSQGFCGSLLARDVSDCCSVSLSQVFWKGGVNPSRLNFILSVEVGMFLQFLKKRSKEKARVGAICTFNAQSSFMSDPQDQFTPQYLGCQ